jgi:Acetyltransferase (GNAT) domain
MDIASYNNCSELDSLEGIWERLSELELQFVPSFAELRHQLENGGSKFRILVATDNSRVRAIACFIYWNGKRSYEIATRTLFALPIKEASLFGACVPGQPDENVIRRLFQVVIEEANFDLINVGEVFVGSPLYKAITSLHDGVIAWRIARKERHWWLIQMPGSFDEYVASLPERTRRHITRDCRKFEIEAPDFRVIQLPDEVEIFLRDAERISRLTYQWKLGCGLRNDEDTRERLIRLAKNGALRCYIVYLSGNPCAFGWGELSHRTFVFQVTGYDPRYRKLSPGTALIMRMIRDLIQNTECEVFDFKWGSEEGYKSRLGNFSLACVPMQVAQIYRPYSLLIIVLDQMLTLFKKLAGSIIEQGPLKQRLRTTLRRYGVGTF